MKRFLVVVTVALASLCCGTKLSAQHNFGIIGGLTFSTPNLKEISKGTMTQYHVGATYKLKLPAGFSFQPSIIYQVKGAKQIYGGNDLSIGYIEIPVSFQWGPDLVLFRPFLDVTPFVGYAVNNKVTMEGGSACEQWTDLNRWEYGLGLGIGVEVWKFQLIGRYNWNFGSLYHIDSIGKDVNFGGFSLSLAFLF